VYQELQVMAGLKQGRSPCPESEKIKPVPYDIFKKTLAFRPLLSLRIWPRFNIWLECDLERFVRFALVTSIVRREFGNLITVNIKQHITAMIEQSGSDGGHRKY
jgi:hypothetical protein